jgi:hypothetical protein
MFGIVHCNARVLNSAAAALEKDGEPQRVCCVYTACNDFKAFFNQFCFHTSELSRFLLTLLRSGRIHVASERVLGFGCTRSSGIA